MGEEKDRYLAVRELEDGLSREKEKRERKSVTVSITFRRGGKKTLPLPPLPKKYLGRLHSTII